MFVSYFEAFKICASAQQTTETECLARTLWRKRKRRDVDKSQAIVCYQWWGRGLVDSFVNGVGKRGFGRLEALSSCCYVGMQVQMRKEKRREKEG